MISSREQRLLADLKTKLAHGPDIVGRDEYINAAVLVPLVFYKGEEHLLFEKRAAHIRQGSEICFPGGHVDRGKDGSALAAALREAEEELGLSPSAVDVIAQLDTIVSPRGIIVECFLGCLSYEDMAEIKLDQREVEETFTVPVRWFRENPPEVYYTRVEIQSSYRDKEGMEHVLLPVEELGLPAHYKQNRSEWKKRVVVYRRESHMIWGLTAAIVHNFIEKAYSGLAE